MATESQSTVPYRVLARKYRPQNFDQLIGQDALVRTLTNAINSGRIAHAFMLTGVRGVGKTTTARIIAKALNYTGADGTAGPTTGPTDDCAVCQAISEDRHPDVIEMDAASRTGIDDIREILDGVRYAPVSARYKVYIIDEVHMLSKQAFNALLKTLEEPPPHVKFIFATTEIRKVPVTVLSRCQRFDLRRVEIPVLEKHFTNICGWEKVGAEDAAISMIARAADGSVRDGLSLLDQAIALGGGVDITAAQVQAMLGLADRGRVLDLLEHALKGEAPEALDIMGDLHRLGADPAVIVQDMLDLTHLMTRLRVAPKTKDMPVGLSPEALERAIDLAAKLSMPTLGRAWQILLKGLGEVTAAPNPVAASEMVIIRLIYAADLPDPSDLLKKIKDMKDTGVTGAPGMNVDAGRSPEPVGLRAVSGGAAVAMTAPMPVVEAAPVAAPMQAVALNSLSDVVAVLQANREIRWATELYNYAHFVAIRPGVLEVRMAPEAHPKTAQEVGAILTRAMGSRWLVSLSSAPGAATLASAERAEMGAKIEAARAHPVVSEVLVRFPGSDIAIKTKDN